MLRLGWVSQNLELDDVLNRMLILNSDFLKSAQDIILPGSSGYDRALGWRNIHFLADMEQALNNADSYA